jgi:hypothetical protein
MRRLLLGMLCALAACDLTGPICTTEAVPAIAVIITDSTTNAPVQSGNLMVVATTGAFSDTLRANLGTFPQNFPWALAHERSGNYRVEVFVTNYHPWSMNNVNVSRNECHVETRTLTARLRPQS